MIEVQSLRFFSDYRSAFDDAVCYGSSWGCGCGHFGYFGCFFGRAMDFVSLPFAFCSSLMRRTPFKGISRGSRTDKMEKANSGVALTQEGYYSGWLGYFGFRSAVATASDLSAVVSA